MKVLITTSGTGSRLGNITKFTNKSLVSIGDKYAISYIIDIYPDNVEFIITIGYNGHLVKDFLELAYPYKKIKYIEIDKYDGEGSSLGYSMLKAKECLQEPFIFHCCDTIIDHIDISKLNNNTLYVSKNNDYISYSSINVKNDNVIRINNKGYENNDYIYTGLCYINDYSIFWDSLLKIYNNNPNNTLLSDIHAIQEMIAQNIIFKYNVINYYDTGNINSYKNTCKQFTNNFNIIVKDNESLCFLNNRVIKFINDPTINNKRILRGVDLYPFSPKILNSRDNFIEMEFIKGTILSESKIYGDIYNLLEWAQNNLWINPKEDNKFITCCNNFYKIKTIERLKKIPFLNNEIHTINGIEVINIFDLLNTIDYSILETNIFTKFHGDFILDNIIKKTNNEYCLLDWRHEFDTEIYYGDMYYDLAKLRHNIIFNHSNILNNLYEITYNNNNVNIDLKCNYVLMKQLDEYNKFIKKYNYNLKKIEILTAIIWLNMAPLYEGKLREFLFYFGKFNLYLALQEVRP